MRGVFSAYLVEILQDSLVGFPLTFLIVVLVRIFIFIIEILVIELFFIFDGIIILIFVEFFLIIDDFNGY